jgi:DNA-binding MarR family transcriptional regulator
VDESPESAAVSAMRELILAAEAYRQAAAARMGLSLTDSQAVSYLLARGPLGQNDLAAALGLTTGSVTPLVDRLERRGIARRQPHATDRRRTIVSLSPEGNELVEDLQGWLLASLSTIGKEDLPRTIETLQLLAAGLRSPARYEDLGEQRADTVTST